MDGESLQYQEERIRTVILATLTSGGRAECDICRAFPEKDHPTVRVVLGYMWGNKELVRNTSRIYSLNGKH